MNPERDGDGKKQAKEEETSQDSRQRLKEIVKVLRRYGGSSRLSPVQFRELLEELGPTFVKVGQILSARPDILPPDYCDELAKLREDTDPMPFSQVKEVLEEELHSPLEDIFLSFDEEPLGSASIAQVHAAVLRPEDGQSPGRPVAVKVQRPGIFEIMSQDMALLKRAAKIVKPIPIGKVIDLEMVLDEIWDVTREEMDFGTEVRNMERFAEGCRDIAYAACPKVEHAYTTSRVLVMERAEGIPISDNAALDAAGYDRREIGEKLADHYVRQVLDDGFFHADPHSGNLLIGNGKIIWLDFGMMGHLSREDRRQVQSAVKAVALHDVEALADAVLSIGDVRGEIDYQMLIQDIGNLLDRYADKELGSLNLSTVFGELLDLAMKHQIALPQGVSLLGRGMVTLEGVLADLSPDISLLKIVANRLSQEKGFGGSWKDSFRDQGRTLLEAVKSISAVPGQMSDLLHKAESGHLKVLTEQTESPQTREDQNRRVQILSLSVLSCGLLIAAGLFSDLPVLAVAGLPWPSFVCGLLGLCAAVAAVGLIFAHRRK